MLLFRRWSRFGCGPVTLLLYLAMCGSGGGQSPSGEGERTANAVHKAGGTVVRGAGGRISGIDLTASRTPVGEELVQAVLRLPDLKMLRITLNAISPETFNQLTARKDLTELALRDVPLTDAELAQLLENRPRLQRLALRRVGGVSDAGLDAVSSLPALEVLSLVEMAVSGRGLAKLQRLPRLRSLDLRKCDALKPNDYRLLAAMKPLKELKLAGPSASDPAMEIVAVMPSIESLVIEDAPVSAVGIRRLADNSTLASRMRSLTFTRCYGVTDDALRVIVTMPRLETLSIRKCPVSGNFLMPWAEISSDKVLKLRTLVLTDAFLSEKALAILPRFASSLRRLDLSRVMLSLRAMKHIGELRELESLRVSGCSLNDETVGPIVNLKKLMILDLSGNYGVTDKSMGLLRTLPRLKHLDTKNTGMTLSNGAGYPGDRFYAKHPK